jgi:hypothetical protein
MPLFEVPLSCIKVQVERYPGNPEYLAVISHCLTIQPNWPGEPAANIESRSELWSSWIDKDIVPGFPINMQLISETNSLCRSRTTSRRMGLSYYSRFSVAIRRPASFNGCKAWANHVHLIRLKQ